MKAKFVGGTLDGVEMDCPGGLADRTCTWVLKSAQLLTEGGMAGLVMRGKEAYRLSALSKEEMVFENVPRTGGTLSEKGILLKDQRNREYRLKNKERLSRVARAKRRNRK